MVKRTLAAILVLMLAVFFSTITFAQDAAKQEEKPEAHKTEMAKGEKEMGPLKSVSCDPKCGFMCRSHNEKELISIVKNHAKKMHKMEMTDAQVKAMIKTEEATKQ